MGVDLAVATPVFLDYTFVGLEGLPGPGRGALRGRPAALAGRRRDHRDRRRPARALGAPWPRRSAATCRASSCARRCSEEGIETPRADGHPHARDGGDAGGRRALDGHRRPGRPRPPQRPRGARAARRGGQPRAARPRPVRPADLRDLRGRRRARLRPADPEPRSRARARCSSTAARRACSRAPTRPRTPRGARRGGGDGRGDAGAGRRVRHGRGRGGIVAGEADGPRGRRHGRRRPVRGRLHVGRPRSAPSPRRACAGRTSTPRSPSPRRPASAAR